MEFRELAGGQALNLSFLPLELRIAVSRSLEPAGAIEGILPIPTPPDGAPPFESDTGVVHWDGSMAELLELYNLVKFTCEMMSLVLVAGRRLEGIIGQRQKPVATLPTHTNFDSVLKWSQYGLAIFPMLLQAIVLAEQTMGSGNGEVKKALVMGAATPFLSHVPDGDQVQEALANAIDNTVATMNSAGQLGWTGPRPVPSR